MSTQREGHRYISPNTMVFGEMYSKHLSVFHSSELLHTSLHCTALNCTALLHTSLHCTALHCTTPHFTTLQITALYYSTMPHHPPCPESSPIACRVPPHCRSCQPTRAGRQEITTLLNVTTISPQLRLLPPPLRPPKQPLLSPPTLRPLLPPPLPLPTLGTRLSQSEAAWPRKLCFGRGFRSDEGQGGRYSFYQSRPRGFCMFPICSLW